MHSSLMQKSYNQQDRSDLEIETVADNDGDLMEFNRIYTTVRLTNE